MGGLPFKEGKAFISLFYVVGLFARSPKILGRVTSSGGLCTRTGLFSTVNFSINFLESGRGVFLESRLSRSLACYVTRDFIRGEDTTDALLMLSVIIYGIKAGAKSRGNENVAKKIRNCLLEVLLIGFKEENFSQVFGHKIGISTVKEV